MADHPGLPIFSIDQFAKKLARKVPRFARENVHRSTIVLTGQNRAMDAQTTTSAGDSG